MVIVDTTWIAVCTECRSRWVTQIYTLVKKRRKGTTDFQSLSFSKGDDMISWLWFIWMRHQGNWVLYYMKCMYGSTLKKDFSSSLCWRPGHYVHKYEYYCPFYYTKVVVILPVWSSREIISSTPTVFTMRTKFVCIFYKSWSPQLCLNYLNNTYHQ